MPQKPLELSSSSTGRAPITSVSTAAGVSGGPIVLLSACPRCGSNYLQALIALHPHCRTSRVAEDFFLANGAILLRFCQSVVESWDDPVADVSCLAAHLGAGLLRFAQPSEDDSEGVSPNRLLLRSPTSEGIEATAALFQDANLVVLVRDGPATVESGRRSFGWWYEEAMLAWRKSVRRILSFMGGGEGHRCHLVRFEDLVATPAREIAKVLSFVGLDSAIYPFDRIDEIPVLGSSAFGREEGETVHWRPVPTAPSFDPLARAAAWPRYRHKRFSWLAGAELSQLGYHAEPLSRFDHVVNTALDVWHATRRIVVRIAVLRHAAPRLFSDRQRKYLSWRHVRIVT